MKWNSSEINVKQFSKSSNCKKVTHLYWTIQMRSFEFSPKNMAGFSMEKSPQDKVWFTTNRRNPAEQAKRVHERRWWHAMSGPFIFSCCFSLCTGLNGLGRNKCAFPALLDLHCHFSGSLRPFSTFHLNVYCIIGKRFIKCVIWRRVEWNGRKNSKSSTKLKVCLQYSISGGLFLLVLNINR